MDGLEDNNVEAAIEEETDEEQLRSVQQKVEVICRTTERYFMQNEIEKGREMVENLEKFKNGTITLATLHDKLYEKDRIIGGISDWNEYFSLTFLELVRRGEIIFEVPAIPDVSQNTVPPTQNTRAADEDSFEQTLEIVPRSQVPVRNGLQVTPFAAFDRGQWVDVVNFHRYALKYLNCVGQVVSIFVTTRGCTFLRFWDGSFHNYDRAEKTFTQIEDTNIAEYLSSPKTSLEIIGPRHYVDIDVYGEHKETVENLKSGDMVAIINLHIYRSKTYRQLTPTIHENGATYGRNVYLLNDEEGEVLDMKRKLCETLERIKQNPNVTGETSRMDAFWHTARPSAQVRPIQSPAVVNVQAVQGRASSLSPPASPIRQAAPTAINADQALPPLPSSNIMKPSTSRLSPIREVPSDRSYGVDSVVDEILLPSKRRRNNNVDSIHEQLQVTSINQNENIEASASSRSGERIPSQQPPVQRKNSMNEETSSNANSANNIEQRFDANAVHEFFRARFPTPIRNILEEPTSPAVTHNGSIFDFIKRRIPTNDIGVQISANLSNVACQTLLEKKLKTKDTHVQVSAPKTKERSVQAVTSPRSHMKSPKNAAVLVQSPSSERRTRSGSCRPSVPLHRAAPVVTSERSSTSSRKKLLIATVKNEEELPSPSEGSRKSNRLSGRPVPPPRVESLLSTHSPKKRQNRVLSPNSPQIKRTKDDKVIKVQIKEERQEENEIQVLRVNKGKVRHQQTNETAGNNSKYNTRSRGIIEQKPIIEALVPQILVSPVRRSR